jgi:hypothetical protein
VQSLILEPTTLEDQRQHLMLFLKLHHQIRRASSKMSTTSTAGTTLTVQQLQGVLNDYTIRLTGEDSTTRHEGIESPNRVEVPSIENPPNWPINHYRVPDYRPVNRDLDPEERPKGSNAGEFAFLSMMFTGVYLNSVSGLSTVAEWATY